jgi:hypothetical protein
MRSELSRAAANLFAGIDITNPMPLSEDEKKRLIALATFAARCRSSVERDGHKRDVELIPDSEAPGRLVGALSRLLAGVAAIGASRPDGWRVVEKVATDCMPSLRLKVIRMLGGSAESVSTSTVSGRVCYPTVTTRRALEDLTAHGVVRCDSRGSGVAAKWRLSDWAIRKCEDAGITFPEMSEEDGNGTFPEMSGEE